MMILFIHWLQIDCITTSHQTSEYCTAVLCHQIIVPCPHMLCHHTSLSSECQPQHTLTNDIVVGLQQICDSYSLENREYFFDRSPRNFDAILGLYRNGKLHLPAGVCVQVSWQWEDIFILSSYILY